MWMGYEALPFSCHPVRLLYWKLWSPSRRLEATNRVHRIVCQVQGPYLFVRQYSSGLRASERQAKTFAVCKPNRHGFEASMDHV